MSDFDIDDGLIMREAAREFRIPYSWLRARVHDGDVRSMRVGKFMLVAREDVEEIAGEGQAIKRVLDARKARKEKRSSPKKKGAKRRRKK